jgi:LysM repeat protein
VAVGAPVVPTVLLAAPAAHAETDWDALAQCESGGDWTIDTGNGFSGGLQFTPSTWRAFGGSGNAEDASRSEQIAVAERVKASQGMNAWPTCSRSTGQTDDSPNSGSSGSASSDDAADARSSADSSSDDSSSDDTGSSSQRSGAASDDSGTSSGDTGAASGGSGASSDETPASVRQAPAAPAAAAGSYTVRAGDTLSSIAASQGTSWRALAQGNPDVLSDPNLIFPGQTLSMA